MATFIKFNKTYPYAHHGLQVERYKKDQIVEISEAIDSQDLYERAISDDAAEEINEKDIPDDVEVMVAERAPIKVAEVTQQRPSLRDSKKSKK